MYFLLVVASVLVTSSAIDCLESLISKMSCYMSSGVLNSTSHSLDSTHHHHQLSLMKHC